MTATLQDGQYIVAAHYSKVRPDDWRWVHFMPKELACKSDGSLILQVEALDKLEGLRAAMAAPLVINSAYRTPEHNAMQEGSSKHSQHCLGKAFDISLFWGPIDPATGHGKFKHDKDRLIALAAAAGFDGIGINYDTFVHVDNRGWRARW